MESWRERVGLITGFTVHRDEMSRLESAIAESFYHHAHLTFTNQHRTEQQRSGKHQHQHGGDRDDHDRRRIFDKHEHGFHNVSPMWLQTAPVYRRSDWQRVFIGETVVPRTTGTRGSPFQMPTRLADGLGPESDRDDGSPS